MGHQFLISVSFGVEAEVAAVKFSRLGKDAIEVLLKKRIT